MLPLIGREIGREVETGSRTFRKLNGSWSVSGRKYALRTETRVDSKSDLPNKVNNTVTKLFPVSIDAIHPKEYPLPYIVSLISVEENDMSTWGAST
jgi:hypothetical protein